MLAVLLTGLFALAGALVAPATWAGAQPIDQQTDFDLACTAVTPLGPEEAEFPLSITTSYPETIDRGSIGQLRISQPPLEVPEDFEGNEVINLNNVTVRLRAPLGFQVTEVALEGGSVSGNISYSLATNLITLVIPGPLAGGSTIDPPEIVVDLRATGAVGEVGSLFVDSFSVAAFLSVPVIGTTTVSVVCPTPDPNPPLATIGITPGAFVPTPQPVVSSANVNGSCSVNYGLLGGGTRTTSLSVPFLMTSLTDVPPGETATVQVDVGPLDWVAAFDASTGGSRQVTGIDNWQARFTPPANFAVLGVSTGAGMNASFDAGTNVITWSRPTGSAGRFGPGPFTPPSLQVELEATGPELASGDLQFSGLGLTVHGDTLLLGLPLGTFTINANCNNINTQTTVIGSVGIVVLPTAVNDAVMAPNNEDAVIDVVANDVAGSFPIDPASVFIVDMPLHGTVTENFDGTVTYSPDVGTLESSDSFSYVVFDVDGRPSNVAAVTIGIVGLYCVAPCSLDQTIELDVIGDTLTLEQAGGSVSLETITLDGEPQPTSGGLQPVTVLNSRGTAASWSVTGQVTDFKSDANDPDCPASDPSTWYFRCIPGDNLGWAPFGVVIHDQVPGDVATIAPGSSIADGLGSTAQSLCVTPATRSGGTFECGAMLTLFTPASAAAQVYSATLTLTLA